MGIIRRREVTLETLQVLVIRRGSRGFHVWCPQCGKQARMVSLDEAMIAAGASWREIHRWMEASDVHFIETTEGFVHICLNSLLRSD